MGAWLIKEWKGGVGMMEASGNVSVCVGGRGRGVNG